MKTLLELQETAATISAGEMPRVHANDTVCFLRSCNLGNYPGHASSMSVVMKSEMIGRCRFRPVFG